MRGAFSEFAERLVENGSTVTPTKGKVPVVPRWQNPRPADPQWLPGAGGQSIPGPHARRVGAGLVADRLELANAVLPLRKKAAPFVLPS